MLLNCLFQSHVIRPNLFKPSGFCSHIHYADRLELIRETLRRKQKPEYPKEYEKAKDGLRHATIFTLRMEPQVIFIKEAGREVVPRNCIRCHRDLLTDSKLMSYNLNTHISRLERKCWECHRETPHGRVNSLSSLPYARVPFPC